MPTARTALIVDDDSTLRYVLARLARLAGYETMEAKDSSSGLEMAIHKAPQVVVADVRLPDYDGFELCRRMKMEKTTKKIPVILVTSMYYETGKVNESIAAGKKKARAAGALELFPRGEALDHLGPLLKKISARNIAARKAMARKAATPKQS